MHYWFLLPEPYPGTIEECILRCLPGQVTELQFFDDRLEGEVVRQVSGRGTWAEKLRNPRPSFMVTEQRIPGNLYAP